MTGRTIVFSGKGGSGKTTMAALLTRELLRRPCKPILTVDADSNATLAETLGVVVVGSIADIRDRMGKAAERVSEIPKHRLLDQMLQECLTEENGFDLLTMGRPEGPKCYCYVNNLLRGFLDNAAESYPFVVIDNEAGMEHLSRRTTDDVDLLLVVMEPTIVGCESALRIYDLTRELPILIKSKRLIVNRVSASGIPPKVRDKLEAGNVEIAETLCYDDAILDGSGSGSSIFELPKDNGNYAAISSLIGPMVAQRA